VGLPISKCKVYQCGFTHVDLQHFLSDLPIWVDPHIFGVCCIGLCANGFTLFSFAQVVFLDRIEMAISSLLQQLDSRSRTIRVVHLKWLVFNASAWSNLQRSEGLTLGSTFLISICYVVYVTHIVCLECLVWGLI
jgi:hypothetical protein